VSQENVELAQKALGRFIATGEPAWDLTHGDVEVYDHDIMDGEDYRGHAGVVRWLEDWSSAWSEFTMEPEEFIDAGDRVVAVVRMRATGRSSGLVLDRQDAVVQELRDGMIVRLDYYNSRDQALKAVGLED
jgi:ketosteroid isomerase-like protein